MLPYPFITIKTICIQLCFYYLYMYYMKQGEIILISLENLNYKNDSSICKLLSYFSSGICVFVDFEVLLIWTILFQIFTIAKINLYKCLWLVDMTKDLHVGGCVFESWNWILQLPSDQLWGWGCITTPST